MVQKEIYNVREHSQGGGGEVPLRALFNPVKWKLPSSDGEFVSSDHKSIQLYVPSSYSIISNIHINRCQTY